MKAEKLFVVVRADLSPGLLAAQAIHGFREFIASHGELEASWYQSSNTLAVLAVPNQEALLALIRNAEWQGFKYAAFREPDLDGQVTSVTLEPRAKRLCRGFQLALT